MADILPATITIVTSIIAATWCLTHGSTICASASVEKGGTSVWGVALNLIGALVLIYGFVAGVMLMVGQVPSPITLLGGIVLLLGFVIIVSVTRTRGDEESITSALNSLRSWGVITAAVIPVSVFFITISGGGGGESMIPESAWPLLLGALTMIGAAFAAALCIVTAVKSGSLMLQQRPELSIWSLLFVALGEGLAIYGLIVAILLVMA